MKVLFFLLLISTCFAEKYDQEQMRRDCEDGINIQKSCQRAMDGTYLDSHHPTKKSLHFATIWCNSSDGTDHLACPHVMRQAIFDKDVHLLEDTYQKGCSKSYNHQCTFVFATIADKLWYQEFLSFKCQQKSKLACEYLKEVKGSTQMLDD